MDVLPGKIMGGLRKCVRFYGGEILHQPQKNLVFCEPVHKVQAGIPAADGECVIYDIEIFLNIEKFVKMGEIPVEV